MPRPDVARRVKSYSAPTGYVYQYYFFEVNRVRRDGAADAEYTYMVSVDRNTAVPLKILVKQSALEDWSIHNGRPLSSAEQYAAAKMRLFQAFDELSPPTTPSSLGSLKVTVDETNLDELLRQVDI
jgi:hypothetical protein